MFFSFDGIDGSGKSTQLQLFCDWLTGQGRTVVACRDPGGTPLGEAIRSLLLERNQLHINRMPEMLLYMASRAQLVEQVIQPALAEGKVVVSDRFLLANVVYQGHAGGLEVPRIWEIGQYITHIVEPNLTFLLDIPSTTAHGRIQRELDRMEQQGDDFRQRLRTGFLAEAAKRPDRIVVIDANRPMDQVQSDIRQAAQRLL